MNYNFYIPGDSLIHKMNSNVKFILMFLFIVTLPMTSLRENLVMILWIQLLIIIAKIPYFYFNRKFLFLIPLTLFFAVALFLYPLLPSIYAVKLSIRIYLMLSIALIVNSTTPMMHLLGLVSYGTSKVTSSSKTKDISMIFLLVINFIPLLLGELSKINQSLNSRNIKAGSYSLNANMFYVKSFVSAIVRRLDILVDEIDLIFYSRNISITNLENISFKQKFKLLDLLMIIILIVIEFFIVKFF